MINNLKPWNKEKHPFHIVAPSPWPFFLSIILFCTVISCIHYLTNNYYGDSYCIFILKIIFFICIFWCWMYDIIVESTYEGYHTIAVQNNLRLGFSLFIVSEVMFFFAFFWAFFHACINPSIWIGEIWPPMFIIPLDAWSIPLLNTFILLSSGLTITWSHFLISKGKTVFNNNPKKYKTKDLELHYCKSYFFFWYVLLPIFNEVDLKYPDYSNELKVLFEEDPLFFTNIGFVPMFRIKYYWNFFMYFFNLKILRNFLNIFILDFLMFYKNHFLDCLVSTRFASMFGFIYTIILGISFSLLQRFEYIHASFTIADGIYASTFYMLTGLHGLHVIIGTIFISVCFIRHINYHFTVQHHVGLEAAIWYWHFVDIVWLFVFIFVYWFGGHY